MTNGVRLDLLHCSRANVERSLLNERSSSGKIFLFTKLLELSQIFYTVNPRLSARRNRYYLQGLRDLFLQEKSNMHNLFWLDSRNIEFYLLGAEDKQGRSMESDRNGSPGGLSSTKVRGSHTILWFLKYLKFLLQLVMKITKFLYFDKYVFLTERTFLIC